MREKTETPLSRTELAAILRSRLEHENNLISQRIGWLVSSQAFLLTAFAISLNGPVAQLSEAARSLRLELLFLLPWLGAGCNALVLVSIAGAILAMQEIRRKIRIHECQSWLVHSSTLPTGLGISLTILMPILFLLIWVAIFRVSFGLSENASF